MNTEISNVDSTSPKTAVKKGRDIFRFKGSKDMALNLERVTNIFIEGNRITFQFYATASYIDMENDDAAQKAYEKILAIWSADAME